MITVGVVAVIVATAGTVAALRFIDVLGDQAETTLTVTGQAVSSIEDTIALADETLPIVESSLATVTAAVGDVGPAIDDIVAVMEEASALAGEDLVMSVEAIRETMPGLIRTARLLTNTLNALSFVGVEFDPEPTLEQSMTDIDAALASMSPRLVEMATLIDEAAISVSGFSTAFDDVATDLEALQASLAAAGVLLDGYAETAADASALVEETKANLSDQTAQLQLLVVLIGIAAALSQIGPVYLGWRLVADAGSRDAGAGGLIRRPTRGGPAVAAGPPRLRCGESRLQSMLSKHPVTSSRPCRRRDRDHRRARPASPRRPAPRW